MLHGSDRTYLTYIFLPLFIIVSASFLYNGVLQVMNPASAQFSLSAIFSLQGGGFGALVQLSKGNFLGFLTALISSGSQNVVIGAGNSPLSAVINVLIDIIMFFTALILFIMASGLRIGGSLSALASGGSIDFGTNDTGTRMAWSYGLVLLLYSIINFLFGLAWENALPLGFGILLNGLFVIMEIYGAYLQGKSYL